MELDLESMFDLDPFEMKDITTLISESTFNIEEFFITEAEGAKKKNIIQKIFGILKKVWSVITAKVSEIYHAFKSIFTTKQNNDKTLDQICEYIFGECNDAPSSKHLKFRYEDDHRVTFNYISNTIKKNIKQSEIVGHDKDDRPLMDLIVLVFHIIKKPYILDPLIEMISSISENNGEIVFEYDRLRKALDNIYSGMVFGLGCTISLEKWTTLNDKVFQLNKAVQVIDSSTFHAINIHDKNGVPVGYKFTKTLNEIVKLTGAIQIGINTIGDSMRQVYVVDSKFHNRINVSNFQEKLPQLVKMFVEYNIPSKYIYNAIHDVCDISINSYYKNPKIKLDKPEPLKGNSRFVLFPSDESLNGKIIKVAYNGLGTRGNRNEFKVWNLVKDIPEIANELYQIYDIGDHDYYVILTDRATPIEHYKNSTEWNKKMRQSCINNNLGFVIRCNDNGFGDINGKAVCIDYGNVDEI